MTRFVRISGLASLMLLCWSASAQGFGWLFPHRSYYYAPVGVAYHYPAYVVPACYTAPVHAPKYAVPRSAPPSQTGEPPLESGSGKPTVTESRSHGAKYASAKAKDDRCRVGFWNITGKDVTIVVDGKSRSLARNQAVTMELARTFTWQIDGRQRDERVPDGQTTLDIILRP
jgi:hypothetical protein